MRNGEAKNLDDLIPRNWTVTVAVPGDAIDMYVSPLPTPLNKRCTLNPQFSLWGFR